MLIEDYHLPFSPSVVGSDRLGKVALAGCKEAGVPTDNISVLQDKTTPVAQLYLKDGDVSYTGQFGPDFLRIRGDFCSRVFHC